MVFTRYGAAIGLAIAAHNPALGASAGVMSFSDFVSGLDPARSGVAPMKADSTVKSPAEFGAMRDHLRSIYGGIGVAHSFALGKNVFDCVALMDQPGVRLQRLSAIAPPPPVAPAAVLGSARAAGPSAKPAVQVAPGAIDAFGNSQVCEAGTIPMRRVTLDEVSRFPTLQDFFRKGPNGAGHSHANGSPTPPSYAVHSYAFQYQVADNLGGYARLDLRWPYVATGSTQVFSLSQEWYIGGTGAATQTAEVGWQNYPALYGTEDSALFVYYTADNYNLTGCYNLTCGAFVQVSSTSYIGHGFAAYTEAGGAQQEVALGYYFYQGNWWLSVGTEWVGYYPGSLYGGGQLSINAQYMEFGGETVGSQSWPGMGSGQWAASGLPLAAYQRTILWRDVTGGFQYPALTLQQPFPQCYTTTAQTWGGPDWQYYFLFGGPGGANC